MANATVLTLVRNFSDYEKLMDERTLSLKVLLFLYKYRCTWLEMSELERDMHIFS